MRSERGGRKCKGIEIKEGLCRVGGEDGLCRVGGEEGLCRVGGEDGLCGGDGGVRKGKKGCERRGGEERGGGGGIKQEKEKSDEGWEGNNEKFTRPQQVLRVKHLSYCKYF